MVDVFLHFPNKPEIDSKLWFIRALYLPNSFHKLTSPD